MMIWIFPARTVCIINEDPQQYRQAFYSSLNGLRTVLLVIKRLVVNDSANEREGIKLGYERKRTPYTLSPQITEPGSQGHLCSCSR